MSDETIRDLDRPFAPVLRALGPRQQRAAMKRAMRSEGQVLKKAAARRIAPSGLGRGTRRPLAASLYARVYPDRYGLGFMVSTTPHGQKRGFHTNRRGRSLPILMWAEDGTRPRRTGHRVLSFTLNSRRTGRWVRHYLRDGQNRGRMKCYDILEQTERAEAPGTESRLFTAFVRSVDREARRAGLL